MWYLCGMQEDAQRIKRINVAVNAETVTALDMLIERENVSLTEAVRRLISYGEFMYRAAKIDGSSVTIHPRGDKPRTVEFI
jgi:ribbon-helix-helix CopG family protein